MEAERKNKWITEGLMIALLPFVSYAIAFTFEAGYFEHFSVPLRLIEIDLAVGVTAFFSLLLTLLIFYVVAEVLNPLWSKLPEAIRPCLYFYFYFLFIIITHLVIARGNVAGIKIILVFIVVMAFFDFVLPALALKDKRTYTQRIAEIHKTGLAYDSAMDKISYAVGFSWFRLVAAILVFLFLSYSTGLGKARGQRTFHVPVGSEGTVILRMYPEKFILVGYDKNTKLVSDSITIRTLASGEKYSFQQKDIGLLVVGEENTVASPSSKAQSNKAAQTDAAKPRGWP